MNLQVSKDDTVARLRDALSTCQIDRALRRAGETLLAHLEKPKQITVMGKAASGKTSLLNLLLGAENMPDLSGIPVVELIHGPKARACIRNDAKEAISIDGLATPGHLPHGTKHVVQELPLPVLTDKSLVEISLPDDAYKRHEIIKWVVDNTDVTIWCTQEFDKHESSMWSAVPEEMKDNSFLVLTKADTLQMRGTLKDQTSRFEQHFANEFLCLYPVATKRALAARQNGAPIDDKLWASSGGKALLDGLKRQIDTGRMADLDHANLLLRRIAASPKALSAAEASSDATEVSVADEDTPDITSGTAPNALDRTSPMKRNEAVDTALSVLNDCADTMLETCSNGTGLTSGDILTRSAQAVQALATLLMDVRADDQQLNTIRENVLEGEQVILLLQLEGTDTAARDAVTALLQLKKEMSEVAIAC